MCLLRRSKKLQVLLSRALPCGSSSISLRVELFSRSVDPPSFAATILLAKVRFIAAAYLFRDAISVNDSAKAAATSARCICGNPPGFAIWICRRRACPLSRNNTFSLFIQYGSAG